MFREESIDPSQEEEGSYSQEEDFLPSQEGTGVRPGRGSAAFLFFLGFSVVVGGLALTFAPEYSWKVTKVARQLDALGFQNGAIVMGGLVLFGLGLVVRSRAVVMPPVQDSKDSDFMLVADQLATDLARMNTSLLQMQAGLSSIEEAQRQFASKRASEEAETAEQHNAMFRMAASLDKLTANVGENLKGFDDQLRKHLMDTNSRLQGAPAPMASAPAAPVAPIPMAPAPAEPQLSVPDPGMPTSDAFLSVEEPASALPAEPEPGVLGDPSQEVFEAFEGLERGESGLPNDLLPDDAVRRALGDS